MNASPRHRVLSRDLRNDLAMGRYKPGERMPSEAQLVRRFAVSRPTVARALRDLQTEGLIERRAGSGTYVRRPAAASSDTRLLGLLIPGLGTTEIFEVIGGELAGLARAHEYSLIWAGSSHLRQDSGAGLRHAEESCRQFIEQRVQGVFFAPFELTPRFEQANGNLAESLRQAGIPVVLLDRDLHPFPRRCDFDLVGLDNFAAGYALAGHLIKLGCRRIRFVARPLSASTVDARFAGCREAMLRSGLPAHTGGYDAGDPADAVFVRTLLAGKPDALICANDFTAAVLMRSIEGAGRRVPWDVRVAGFDDVKYATLLSVPLTTMHQPCRDIAAAALQTMLARIADPALPPHSHSLSARLVVRESCGAYLPRPAGARGR